MSDKEQNVNNTLSKCIVIMSTKYGDIIWRHLKLHINRMSKIRLKHSKNNRMNIVKITWKKHVYNGRT